MAAARREPVLKRLSDITTTDASPVLQQAKTVFAQQQWTVQGNVYQAGGDIHIHNEPAQPKLRGSVLRGQVFFIEGNDELSTASDVSVTLLQADEEARTNSRGLFRLSLPSTFQPGATVKAEIQKDGWVLYAPIDGAITIPALDSDLVNIRLVKKGSLKLLSAERIEKLIQDMAGKSKEQVRPEGKPQEIDFSRYIKEWAMRYGFSAQQAKKNFGEAGKRFEASAERKARRAHEASTTALRLTEEAIRDFRLAGDAIQIITTSTRPSSPIRRPGSLLRGKRIQFCEPTSPCWSGMPNVKLAQGQREGEFITT